MNKRIIRRELRAVAPSVFALFRDLAGAFALMFAIVTWVCLFSII